MTDGVVRVGDTVRRPVKASSSFVRSLLALLAERGFEAAPRYLGADEQGREVFTFLRGEVPPDLDSTFTDETLAHAARLIRRYHDATAGSALAAGREVVCHGDLSPCNTVFQSGVPVALIDFDAAAPGDRLDDLGYALFLWLALESEGLPVQEQARRIDVFCAAYGVKASARVVSAILRAVGANVGRLRNGGHVGAAAWWGAQHAWIANNEGELARSRA
ncbi:MAG TPA: phosphotransferase [Polyangiaceae bacterium]